MSHVIVRVVLISLMARGDQQIVDLVGAAPAPYRRPLPPR
jgi:hypothetical protein